MRMQGGSEKEEGGWREGRRLLLMPCSLRPGILLLQVAPCYLLATMTVCILTGR